YSANYADKQYAERRKNCGRKPILEDETAKNYVVEKLEQRWSPEQIAGRTKLKKQTSSFSYPTIYRAIDSGILPKQLKKIMRFKWKHKKCKGEDKRGKIPDRTSIHERLAGTGMKVFFCDPYSPWQRGTNENTNGLLRQFFPKGTSFADISGEELQAVVDLINNRPRKRLGFRSPAELFLNFL
ncbi:MAG: IS30 family transposase, partial [Prevotella sp.]|nr:IS30 family transposase [Prevotella sp.]